MNPRAHIPLNFSLVISGLLISCLLFYAPDLGAKKIKHSFTIAKEKKEAKKKSEVIIGNPIELGNSSDTEWVDSSQNSQEIPSGLVQSGFAGYDKEPNSNIESFILINKSDHTISGYEVRIDYLDMQGRMLHSRVVRESCDVPPQETRRLDIKSWDTQRTYYYYLGNAPRKVATPYQVSFTPLTFWII